MQRDRIIELAKQAGLFGGDHALGLMITERVERFAALIEAETIERCILTAEKVNPIYGATAAIDAIRSLK